MGLRYWFAGGAAAGWLTLIVLGIKGAWTIEVPSTTSLWVYEAPATLEAAEGWEVILIGLGLTAWLAWLTASGPGAPRVHRGRTADVCGALALSAVVTASLLLVAFAALGYQLRPALVALLDSTRVSTAAPFVQVCGSFAWGVFLVDLAWRLHVPPTERGVAGDRVAAALAGALLVIVGVCGVRPPYFMH